MCEYVLIDKVIYMESNNNIILNRIFTKNTFSDLLNGVRNASYYKTITRYLNKINEKENRVIISEIYDIIKSNYRNEYFYKNTLLNKLLLGKHSLNTTTALTEVPINKSKADLVLINGKAVVYEIKTGLDTFERLESQISNYYKAFNHVCVVTCEANYDKLVSILGESKVGIYVLSERNTISKKREPIEDNSLLEYNVLFRILRKLEFENIIKQYYGDLPETTQVKYYQECFKLFCDIEIDIVYKLFLKELKKRNKIEIEQFNQLVPYELKFLIYFSKYKQSDYVKLNNFLNSMIGG